LKNWSKSTRIVKVLNFALFCRNSFENLIKPLFRKIRNAENRIQRQILNNSTQFVQASFTIKKEDAWVMYNCSQTEPFDDPVAYKGEVIVGLKFVPPDPAQQERDRESSAERSSSKAKKNWSRGALHVLVKEARNLQTRGKNSGTCDPFCKRYTFYFVY